MARQQQTDDTDPRLEGLDRFIKKCLKDWEVPGVAVAVVSGGNVIYARGFGLRNVRRKLPVDEETHFAIGSCTKAFAATTAGILVDEGKLEWDKPVRDYVPTFRLHDHVASERTTLRDLLSHRTGLPRHDLSWYGGAATRAELFDRLRHLKPTKDFRSLFQYQNLMFMSAGVVVEQVTEGSWEDFAQARILDPLGMETSSFSVTDLAENENGATGYLRKGKRVAQVPYRNIDAIGPAGCINSNVVEMSRWILLQLSRAKAGRKGIISEKNLKEIHSPHTVIPESFAPLKYKELLHPTYALGWMEVPYRGFRLLHHGGGIDGFNAHVSFMPSENVGAVVLTNITGSPLTSVIPYSIYDRLLGLEEVPWNTRALRERAKQKAKAKKRKPDKDRKKGTRTSAPLKSYAGEYHHPGYGSLPITWKNRQLTARFNSLDFELKHYHHDVFSIEVKGTGFFDRGMKLKFELDKLGKITSARVPLEPTGEDLVFEKAESGEGEESA